MAFSSSTFIRLRHCVLQDQKGQMVRQHYLVGCCSKHRNIYAIQITTQAATTIDWQCHITLFKIF